MVKTPSEMIFSQIMLIRNANEVGELRNAKR